MVNLLRERCGPCLASVLNNTQGTCGFGRVANTSERDRERMKSERMKERISKQKKRRKGKNFF